MKRLHIACLAFVLQVSCPAFAAQGLVISQTTGTTSQLMPNRAPYNAVTNLRVEWRMHNFTFDPSNYRDIFGFPGFEARTSPGAGAGSLLVTEWNDNPNSKNVTVNMGAATDVICRFQRLYTAGTGAGSISLECWQANGSNYLVSTYSGLTMAPYSVAGYPFVTGVGENPNNGMNGSVDWIRFYSTVLPLGTPLSNATGGDLGDWEFNGNLLDSSNQKLNMTALGPAAYGSTPVYPVLASFGGYGQPRSFAAGHSSLPLNASCFSAIENAQISYTWQQLGGPTAGVFSSQVKSNPTFSAPLAGTYQIQLACSAPGAPVGSPAVVKMGGVATDANGVVITGNPAMDELLGPLTLFGSSPWPYYDLAEMAVADTLAPAALANVPAVPATEIAGTVTTQVGNQAITVHNDPNFASDFQPNNIYLVTWDGIEGPQSGRALVVVSQVDAIHGVVTLQSSAWMPTGTWTGIYNISSEAASGILGNWGWGANAGGNNWNYYDSISALYRLCYRSGIDTYCNYADQMADVWWDWGLDHGQDFPIPRVLAPVGVFMRVVRGGLTNRYPGLATIASFLNSESGANWASTGSCPGSCKWNYNLADMRETSAITLMNALGAQYDTDAGRHANYCSQVQFAAANWVNSQVVGVSGGYWPESSFVLNQSYPFTVPQTFPWKTDWIHLALEHVYDALNNSSDSVCYNPALATNVLTAIQNSVNLVWNLGRSTSGGGIWYSILSAGDGEHTPATTGLVSAVKGSAAVVGAGTNFTTALQPGSTIGFWDGSAEDVYVVASITDDTHLTLAAPVTGAGIAGQSWHAAIPAHTSCPVAGQFPSQITTWGGGGTTSVLLNYCTSDTWPNGDPNLPRLAASADGWMFLHGGSREYLQWGDQWFNAVFSGPADGPGGVLPPAAPAGLTPTGYQSDYVAALPPCGNGAAAPCGGFGVLNSSGLGKNFGQGSGVGAAQTYLAARAGGVQSPRPRRVVVNLDPASVGAGVQAKITVTQPSGASSTETCASAPCLVTIDARQGQHLVTVQYVNAEGKVVASGGRYLAQ